MGLNLKSNFTSTNSQPHTQDDKLALNKKIIWSLDEHIFNRGVTVNFNVNTKNVGASVESWRPGCGIPHILQRSSQLDTYGSHINQVSISHANGRTFTKFLKI